MIVSNDIIINLIILFSNNLDQIHTTAFVSAYAFQIVKRYQPDGGYARTKR